MFLDGDSAPPRCPGSFGSMPDQISAALSRDRPRRRLGGDTAPGRPGHGASSLWIGAVGTARSGRRRSQHVAAHLGARRRGVGGGRRQQRRCASSRRPPPGQPARIPWTPAVTARSPASSRRTATSCDARAAMVKDGQVILASRRADAAGRVRPDLPAPAGVRPRFVTVCVGVVAHRRRHGGQPRGPASGGLRQPRRGQLRRAGPQPGGPGRRHRRGQPVGGLRRPARRHAAVGSGAGTTRAGPTSGRSSSPGRSRCCRADLSPPRRSDLPCSTWSCPCECRWLRGAGQPVVPTARNLTPPADQPHLITPASTRVRCSAWAATRERGATPSSPGRNAPDRPDRRWLDASRSVCTDCSVGAFSTFR